MNWPNRWDKEFFSRGQLGIDVEDDENISLPTFVRKSKFASLLEQV
jgi:hypothetical protein